MIKKVFITALMIGCSILGYGQVIVTSETNNSGATTADVISSGTNEIVIKPIAVKTALGVLYFSGKTYYASSNILFIINAVDKETGVKKVYTMLDERGFFVYTNTPISFTTEGKHSIGYRVEDNVGNKSAIKVFDFFMDKTPPKAHIKSIGKMFTLNNVNFISSNAYITVYASDTASGVSSLDYSVDDGVSNTVTGSFMAVGTKLNPGYHKINYRARDNVSNSSIWQTYQFFVDNNPPQLSFTSDLPFYEVSNKIYMSPEAKISIEASDVETAVDRVLFSIDNGEFADYNYPFDLTSGKHIIAAKASDILGNMSEPVYLTIIVDGGTPEVQIVPTR